MQPINEMDLNALFTELGITDYTYVQLSTKLDELEIYRSKLLNRIGELQYAGNGENMDNASGIQQNIGRKDSE